MNFLLVMCCSYSKLCSHLLETFDLTAAFTHTFLFLNLIRVILQDSLGCIQIQL